MKMTNMFTGTTSYNLMNNGVENWTFDYAGGKVKYFGNYVKTKYSSSGLLEKEVWEGGIVEFNIPFEHFWSHPNLSSPVSSEESSVGQPTPVRDPMPFQWAARAGPEAPLILRRTGPRIVHTPSIQRRGKGKAVARLHPARGADWRDPE